MSLLKGCFAERSACHLHLIPLGLEYLCFWFLSVLFSQVTWGSLSSWLSSMQLRRGQQAPFSVSLHSSDLFTFHCSSFDFKKEKPTRLSGVSG